MRVLKPAGHLQKPQLRSRREDDGQGSVVPQALAGSVAHGSVACLCVTAHRDFETSLKNSRTIGAFLGTRGSSVPEYF